MTLVVILNDRLKPSTMALPIVKKKKKERHREDDAKNINLSNMTLSAVRCAYVRADPFSFFRTNHQVLPRPVCVPDRAFRPARVRALHSACELERQHHLVRMEFSYGCK